MTEQEWLESKDDAELWESDFLWGKTPERTFQLFAVACMRRIWHLLPVDHWRQAVELLERCADDLCTESDIEEFDSGLPEEDHHAGLSEAQSHAVSAAITCLMDREYRLASTTAHYSDAAIRASIRDPDAPPRSPEERPFHCDLIRELVCNPFRPVTIDPAWQTSTVVALAHAAYDNRILPAGTLEPVRLSILADALDEAGCDNADILNHLRQPGEHVRGCWAVDLLLGKR